MTVVISLTRKAIVLDWDAGDGSHGKVDITAENPDTGRISERKGVKNDGKEAVFTVPRDYHGPAHFTFHDGDHIVDEGDVTI